MSKSLMKFFTNVNTDKFDKNYIDVKKLKATTKQITNMKKEGINWCDFSWNPWKGCEKVSAACKHCYIARLLKDPYGIVQKTTEDTWSKPFKIKEPSIIFPCNLSDFFIKQADKWRKYAWEVIKNTPHHTYLILTKRPERIKECLPSDWGNGYPNVWLGVTVEDDTTKVLKRLDDLREIPAVVKWVSVEPIYKEFNFTKEQVEGFDWFVLGGESGGYNRDKWRYEGYRPCNARWIYNLMKKLKSYNKSVWIKQFGTDFSLKKNLKSNHAEDWDEFHPKLRVREYPITGLKPRNIKPPKKKK